MPEATFVYAGHPHVLVKRRQRRYGQDGCVIQRVHENERCGYPYWVALTSLSEEARDACATRSAG